MHKNCLKSLLALLLLCSTAWLEISARTSMIPSTSSWIKGPVLTVTQPTPFTAIMSWTPFGTANEYRVTVTDLTTNTVLAAFNTSYAAAKVGGIVTGHVIQYNVQNDKIILELIAPG